MKHTAYDIHKMAGEAFRKWSDPLPEDSKPGPSDETAFRYGFVSGFKKRLFETEDALAGIADPAEALRLAREALTYIINGGEGREFYPNNLDGSPNERFESAAAALAALTPAQES